MLADGTTWIGTEAIGYRVLERTLIDALGDPSSHDAATTLTLGLVGVAEQALFSRRNPVELCAALTALAVGNHTRNTQQATDLVNALNWTLSEWLMHPDVAASVTAKALFDLLSAGPTVDPDTALTYVMSRLSGLPMESRRQAAGVLLGAIPPPINAEILPDIEFR